MRKWKGWWIPTPVTGKEKDSWGCYATEQTEKCSEIQCQDCIYWNLDGQAEWRLKEYLKELKQRKEQARDSKGRFCKKGETVMLWEGFVVPMDPKREWGEWMCSEKQCPGTSTSIQCIYGNTATCAECIYSRYNHEARRCFYEQYYGKYPTSVKNELPKLTVEVFNRPDCPEWAQWAAVDIDGNAYWFDDKPVRNGWAWLWGTYDLRFKSIPGNFDSSDWEHSLIQRPAKELPELTQTAFHCPDCPKEAATLKVFPANHVVALDKDDKVLSVMELQCQEGEVSKSEWFYSHGTLKLYQKDDYRRDIPRDAVPVRVHYLSPSQLIGKAVTNDKTGKNYLVAEVNGLTVTLQGVDKKELLSMPTLVQFYSFVDTKCLCCSFETLQ